MWKKWMHGMGAEMFNFFPPISMAVIAGFLMFSEAHAQGINKSFAQGYDMLQKGMYAQAAELFRRGLTVDPQNPDAAFYLAQALENIANADLLEVEQLYGRAARSKDVQIRESAERGAKRAAEKAALPEARFARESNLYFSEGYSKFKNRDFEASEKLLSEGLKSNPNFYLAHYYLAESLMGLRTPNRRQAISHYRHVRELSPQSKEAVDTLLKMSEIEKCLAIQDESIQVFNAIKGGYTIELVDDGQAAFNIESVYPVETRYECLAGISVSAQYKNSSMGFGDEKDNRWQVIWAASVTLRYVQTWSKSSRLSLANRTVETCSYSIPLRSLSGPGRGGKYDDYCGSEGEGLRRQNAVFGNPFFDTFVVSGPTGISLLRSPDKPYRKGFPLVRVN